MHGEQLRGEPNTNMPHCDKFPEAAFSLKSLWQFLIPWGPLFILLFLELQFLFLEKIIPLSLSFRCLLTSTVVLWLCGIARGWGKRDQKKAKPIQGISLNIRRLRVTFFFFFWLLGLKSEGFSSKFILYIPSEHFWVLDLWIQLG